MGQLHERETDIFPCLTFFFSIDWYFSGLFYPSDLHGITTSLKSVLTFRKAPWFGYRHITSELGREPWMRTGDRQGLVFTPLLSIGGRLNPITSAVLFALFSPFSFVSFSYCPAALHPAFCFTLLLSVRLLPPYSFLPSLVCLLFSSLLLLGVCPPPFSL